MSATLSPRRITILADAVANQIAAGEVVDRPASVVKELVENAIDAGARHVRVDIAEGGKSAVIVSDDGSGMTREDAILALDRHATSKIVTAADLVGVATFGFRGEALPAIASVSRFTLATSTGGDEATEVAVTGGRVDRVTAVARQRGTTVAVRNLFFNTPARRKFLRSVASEARAAWDVIGVLALCHPDVGFEFVTDESVRLAVPPGQDEPTRLAAIWGRDVVATLVPVRHAVGPVAVEGMVQRPAEARPTGRRTQLFVNGRPFRDPGLIRAAEAGYRSAIAPGDRPSLLLRITVPPADVDVNVHPAKLEVRFRERFAVDRAVEEAVRLALGSLEASTSIAAPADRPIWRPTVGGGGPVESAELPLSLDEGAEAPRGPAAARTFSAPVIQLHRTYLVFETGEGVVFVDQHSAHERVIYEQVMAELEAGQVSGQRLLLPITLELTDEELEVVERFAEELTRIGFEVEPFGGRSVVLHAVPTPHPRFDATACFREMVADLARGRFGGWANRLERFAATFACRAAVKAGTALSEPEMRALLLRLFETELPPHDVHGRSTIVTVPVDELERRFGRR
ncbi:MAG: DNA mismatch repair endonuclease MutL [Gemmatimonadetes bacterium]|nr:DNA mismatch repair endonuclease MutL [Gemmatimonadota bacterium]